MKSVALVGYAEETRDAVRKSQADEIWSINWAYKYDFIPRIDRLFEMHPVWVYGASPKPEHVKMKDHWEWLRKPHPYPVYMLTQLPQVPACVRYPIEEVTNFIFDNKLIKGGNPHDFFGSSVDYMLALAVYEGFERIELYGIEMGSMTEYRYQRESAAFFIGRVMQYAQIILQPESVLLRGKKYGYEGGQMIFRQDLERMLIQWEEKKQDATARLQHAEGQLAILAEKGTPKELDEINRACMLLRDELMVASGGEQLLIYQIREIDLEEPELKLENPIAKVIEV